MKIFPQQVHLWFTFDKQINNDLSQQYYQLLNNKERTQQERFHFKKHRHQYLVTRALVRSVLSLYQSHIDPGEWKFNTNEFGRPYINNLTSVPLYFNVTHTDGLIVLAISQNQTMGIDAEILQREQHTDISESVLTDIEHKHLLSLPLEQQKQQFYEIWTLKEAYIKARSKGLSIPLKNFWFNFYASNKSDLVFYTKEEDGHDWQFWRIQPNKMHIVSLAAKTGIEHKDHYIIKMNEYKPLAELTEAHYPISTRIQV